MNRLIRWSLDHRGLVVVLAALVCAGGLYEGARANVDVFPDLDRPGVSVMTHIPGLSPEETEALLTDPIEAALRGTPGLEAVWSSSSIGLSHVHVVFGWGEDLEAARARVAQRLQAVQARLPAGATPLLLPFVSVMGEVELIGISGAGPAELRRIADERLRPRLLAIPGVAQVLVIGGELQELGVEVDPAKLERAGVTLADVRRAIAGIGKVGIGGILPHDNQEYLIRILAAPRGAEDVAAAVVRAPSAGLLRVRDLATVAPVAILQRGIAGIDAGPGVILSVYKGPGEDTRRISEETGRAIFECFGPSASARRPAEPSSSDALRPDLPRGLRVDRIFDQAEFIQAAISNVVGALREGALLVVLVLLIFLASLRTSAVTLTALPVSLLGTLWVLHVFGVTVNTLTLGGLAVAVGQLVDDAIVDVENVWRRLAESRRAAALLPLPGSSGAAASSVDVIFAASTEVRGSIVYATLVVVLAVVPLALLSGVEGRLFRPLVVAYVVSVAMSLLVSVTLTPALCELLLGRAPPPRGETRLLRWLKGLDRKLLDGMLRPPGLRPSAGGAVLLPGMLRPPGGSPRALARPALVLAGAGVLCAAGLFALRLPGRELLPPFNEGTLTVNVIAVPGITLADSDRLGSIAERLLLEVPEVVRTGRRTGRAELDTHSAGIHSSEIEVALRPGRARSAIEADIRGRLAALPGVVVYLGQPISHRLEHLLEGMNGQIVVRIFGADLARLRALAEDARAAMAAVPGVVDLQVEKQLLVPELGVVVDREKAAALGLNAGDVAQAAQDALYGATVGSVPVDGRPKAEAAGPERSLAIRVRVAAAAQRDPEAIGELPIPLPGGGSVPLRAVARLEESAGQDYLNHDDGRRFIAVTANATGDVAEVAQAVERAIDARLKLGSGEEDGSAGRQAEAAGPEHFNERVSFGGVWAAERRARRSIALFSALSLGLIALALLWHFRSVALTLVTLLNVPLSLVGSVAALLVFREKLSLATAVGFIAVCGIASRNSILLLSHYLHLVEREGERFGAELIVRGSLERLPPMLMTALTAGLAMVPLLFAREAPGKELLGPIAVAIVGGLVSSTLLDLAVTPAAFFLFGGPAARSREPKVASMPLAPGLESAPASPSDGSPLTLSK